MSAQGYIRSITELTPDDFPSLTPLPEGSASESGFFSNISWTTWIIIIFILALLGINVFAYLAKGTEETASIFQQLFAPILKLFGYTALTTTKQTIQTAATGTKAGVDIVEKTTTGAIDTVIEPRGQEATTSLPVNQQAGTNKQPNKWRADPLEHALEDASQKYDSGPLPNDSSMITGKAGWCFIGEDQGIRTCSEIGANDMCMSGDIFPTQAVCMNPNLRA